MGAGDVKQYNGASVSIGIGSIIPQGLGPQEFLLFEEESDAFTDQVSVDGEVVREQTNDARATYSLTLMQTSATNDLLSALHRIDKRTKGGAGVISIFVRDQNGRAVHKAEKCWIAKGPSRSYGRTAGMRVWKLRAARNDSFDGGN